MRGEFLESRGLFAIRSFKDFEPLELFAMRSFKDGALLVPRRFLKEGDAGGVP